MSGARGTGSKGPTSWTVRPADLHAAAQGLALTDVGIELVDAELWIMVRARDEKRPKREQRAKRMVHELRGRLDAAGIPVREIVTTDTP